MNIWAYIRWVILMTSNEYVEYLKTDKWHALAKQRMQIDGHKCAMCGCQGTNWNKLETHHITYRSLGREDVWKDVLTLCKSCHQSVHVMMNRRTAENRHGWKDDVKVSNHVLDIDC